MTPHVDPQFGLTWEVRGADKTARVLDVDVFSVRGLISPADGITTLSPLAYAREAIGLGLAAQEFGATWFGNGASPKHVIKHPMVLNPAGIQRIREKFEATYGGAGSNGTMVLDEGMTIEKTSVPAEDSQFLETRRANWSEIAGWFGVPPQFVGDFSRATWGNAEQMDIFLAKYTLSAWCRRIEDEVSAKLYTQAETDGGQYAKFAMQALLRGDSKARGDFYRVMRDGIVTPNEIRAWEELPPLPGFDTPLVPGNMGGAPPDDADQSGNDNPAPTIPADDPDNRTRI